MSEVDDWVGNSSAFPVLKNWNYLNHAGISPLPACCAAAMRRYADAFEGHGYLGEVGFDEFAKLRGALAELIKAEPVEIAFQKNTGEAISTIAFGLNWKQGDRIVIPAVEYPANVYPWMEVCQRHGVELVTSPERDRPDGSRAVDVDELLAAAGNERCRMVAVSHVQYASGQRLPLERIGAFCRSRGKYFCVDAIQSMGALPINVRAMQVDFLAAGSQKWLLGPMGVGMIFIRKELMQKVQPLAFGAYSVVDPDNYGDINFTLQPDNRRHECGTPPLVAMAGLRASVELLNSLDTTAIAERVRGLTNRLTAGLHQRGWRMVSPRDEESWSGIVAFLPPGGQDLQAIQRRLRQEHRIELMVRENHLRAAPHFYNTEAQMGQLLNALDEVVVK